MTYMSVRQHLTPDVRIVVPDTTARLSKRGEIIDISEREIHINEREIRERKVF